MWKRLGSVPAGAGNRWPALQQHLSPGEWQHDDGDDGGDDDDDDEGDDGNDDIDDAVVEVESNLINIEMEVTNMMR